MIEISTKLLSSLLKEMKDYTNPKASLEILKHVCLLPRDKGALGIRGTDLRKSLNITLPAAEDVVCSLTRPILVPIQALEKFIGKRKQHTLYIEPLKDKVKLVLGKSELILSTEGVEDRIEDTFPNIELSDAKEASNVFDGFLDKLARSFHALQAGGISILGNVNLKTINKEVCIFTTDGYMMFKGRTGIKSNKRVAANIPFDFMKTFVANNAKSYKPELCQAFIDFSHPQRMNVCIQYPGLTKVYTVRLEEGQFPDCQRVLDSGKDIGEWQLPLKPVLEELEVIHGIKTTKDIPICNLALNNEIAYFDTNLDSGSKNRSQYKFEIPLQVPNDTKHEIPMNSTLLLKALANYSGETVYFRVKSESDNPNTRRLIVHDGNEYLDLIMPVRS